MSNFKDNAIGTATGVVTFIGLTKASKNVFEPASEKIIKTITKYSPEEKLTLWKATEDAFELSGLKKARVHLHSVNSKEEVDKVSEMLTRKVAIVLKKNKFWKFLKKTEDKLRDIEKKLSRKSGKGIINNTNGNKKFLPEPPVVRIDKKFKKIIQTVAKVKNAFYYPITKDIVINQVKFPAASFHEMGHAMNATGSKLMKTLAVGRHVSALIGVPLILAVGFLKPKKKDGEKPKGVFDKTTTFIKSNAGKLTFLALIPTIAEEGIASIRGGKLAKKVLNPGLLKKLNKNNTLAWSTYLAGTLLISGFAAFSVKIRDIAASNPEKSTHNKNN